MIENVVGAGADGQLHFFAERQGFIKRCVHIEVTRTSERILQRLEQIDSRAARVIELRWFVGLSVEEAAHVMGISEKTLRRDWNFAKAWLQSELDANKP